MAKETWRLIIIDDGRPREWRSQGLRRQWIKYRHLDEGEGLTLEPIQWGPAFFTPWDEL